VRSAQQIICRKCDVMSNVQAIEKSNDNLYFVRCQQCGAKNQIVQTGATLSQPGLLQVMGLIE